MTTNSVERILGNYDEAVIRAQIRTSLIDWAASVMKTAGLTPSTHHRVLLKSLELLTSGHIRRLMVLMPPGSAKSTYASVNSDLWGQYVPTPSVPGTWYAWVEGSDGSAPTLYATPFTVT